MKNIFILFTSIIASLLLFSCSDDFLDRQPLDSQVSSTFYKTENDARRALVSIYDVLGYQSTPGVSWAPYLTVSDILSDDSYAGGADANDGQDENELDKFNIPTSSQIALSIWKKNYTGIYRANLLLEKIDGIDASDEFKSQVIAECKFLRAYFYFEQVKFFENIPLLTNTINSPEEYIQEQNTPKEVYDQIALDLVDAIEVLPAAISSTEPGRVNKWAAEALLARVFLFYNGVYGDNLQAGSETIDQAATLTYLEDLISNSGHALLEEYDDVFRNSSEFSLESVFEISYGDSPVWWDWNYPRGGEGNLAAQMQGPRVTGSDNFNRGWSFAPVSYKLFLDMENDPRLSATILQESDLDGNLVKGYQHTGYFSAKYTSDAEHYGSGGQFELNRTTNYRVIRYSDVLLMAAELGSANAQSYLDMVRSRAGLESVPATKENILKERRLELSLEGHRYFDVLRQGLDVAADELTVVGLRGPLYIDDQVEYDVNFDEATRGFLPIPQTEMDLSSGTFQQNDGY